MDNFTETYLHVQYKYKIVILCQFTPSSYYCNTSSSPMVLLEYADPDLGKTGHYGGLLV